MTIPNQESNYDDAGNCIHPFCIYVPAGKLLSGYHSHFPQANTVESSQENKIVTKLLPEAGQGVEITFTFPLTAHEVWQFQVTSVTLHPV